MKSGKRKIDKAETTESSSAATAGVMEPEQQDGASVLSSVALAKEEGRMYVPIGEVRADPDQPRKAFDQAKLEELAESIRQQGVVQDLIVVKRQAVLKIVEPDLVETQWRVVNTEGKEEFKGTENNCHLFAGADNLVGFYQIVDGERRWRAAQLAGLTEVPVQVRVVDEKMKLALQVVANQQRENLSALEEASAYAKEIESGRHTAESLYKALGISRGTLFSRLALNRLQPPVREALVAGKISVSVAGLIAMIPERPQQEELLKRVGGTEFNQPWSVRDVRETIESEYMKQLKDATFDVGDPDLVEMRGDRSYGGSCKHCPQRTGNMLVQFPELANRPNVCTMPSCFAQKVEVAMAAKLAKAEAEGKTVLSAEESRKIFPKYSPTTVSYGAPFVKLSDTCEADPKGRTYQTLLKDKAPAPVVAIDGMGELQEVVREADVEVALRERGFEWAKDRQVEQAEDKAEQEKRERLAKQREEVGPTLLGEMVAKLEKLPTDGKTESEFWRFVIGWLPDDNWEEVCARREHAGKTMEQATKGMTLKELRAMVVELLVSDWNYGLIDHGGQWNEQFEAGCELAGLDLKAREKALAEKGKAESEKAETNPPSLKLRRTGKAKKKGK